jgi:hypothetical protein
MSSGQYFQGLEKWTLDREEAYDFGRVAQALKFAHKAHLDNAELVLSFDRPGEVTSIPFKQLMQSLPRSRRRHAGA